MDRQRVAELFEQAVDLPDSERAAWVEAACGSDAARTFLTGTYSGWLTSEIEVFQQL